MYGMKEICEKTDLSYSTLKFYCNEGLIPNVKRDKNNHRIFDDNDLHWIKNLNCLRDCNLSIVEMKEYISLCLAGNSTIPERKIFLKQKQDDLRKKIAALNDAVAYIDWKQNFYDNILSGETEPIDYFTATGK